MSTRRLRHEHAQHPLSKILPKKPRGRCARRPARSAGSASASASPSWSCRARSRALAGAPNLPFVTRMHGLREIAIGTGLLMSRDPPPWLWGRVAGDVIDVATVGAGPRHAGRPGRTLVSLAMLGGIAYVDMKAAEGGAPRSKRESGPRPRLQRALGLPEPGGRDARRRAASRARRCGKRGHERHRRRARPRIEQRHGVDSELRRGPPETIFP